jgi:hypothetical protein
MQQSEKESPVLGFVPDLKTPMCKRKHFDVYSPPLDWQSASDYCNVNRMNLASFKTFKEAVYFTQRHIDIWIGINDFATPGIYQQISGDSIPDRAWYLGQPAGRGCVYSDFYGFRVGPCDSPLYFACEWFEDVSCENAKQYPEVTYLTTPG